MVEPPCLLHFRVSHYNEKVRWALDWKGWPHRRQAYVPGFHVAPVRLRTGQNQLPVLLLEGETIIGSSRILAEIERRRPEPPLFPAGAAERERARSIERFFDEEVAPDVRRLFWSAYLDHPGVCARMAADGASALTAAAWRAVFPAMRPLFRSNMGVKPAQVERARQRLGGYFDRLEEEIAAA
jgi:glutathione S-transferase